MNDKLKNLEINLEITSSRKNGRNLSIKKGRGKFNKRKMQRAELKRASVNCREGHDGWKWDVCESTFLLEAIYVRPIKSHYKLQTQVVYRDAL